MHFILCILVIYLVWRRGVWKDWKKYHSTMLFFSFMELLYRMIVETNNHFLWKIEPDLFLTRVTVVSLYIFIVFPLSTLLFLSAYPVQLGKQILHIAEWVLAYIFVEWIATLTNRIVYYNGWRLWHSFIFDIILFCGLRFHYKKPFTSYIVFILVTISGIWLFKVPI